MSMRNGLNSCLYDATVYHRRIDVRKHEFRSRIYTWYLDLDELEALSTRHRFLFGLNTSRVYTFRDKDHFRFWTEARKLQALESWQGQAKGGVDASRPDSSAKPSPGQSHIRAYIDSYFREKEQPVPSRIVLLTNLRYLGYGFNPVSFYFAFNQSGELYAILSEVNNTFGEQKPYLILLDNPVHPEEEKRIFARAWKNFYVSPFIHRDRDFVFRIKCPGKILSLGIDTYEGPQPVLRAAYSGKRQDIASGRMLLNMLRFPFVTLKVIALIHWHALLLFLKKVPFFSKDETDIEIRKHEKERKEVTHATV